MALRFGSTVLLMRMDDPTGGQPTLDSSPSPKSVSPQGGVIISTAESKFGGKSAYFDGSGDWLHLSAHQDWDFLNGDFTIEFWVYFDILSNAPHIVNVGYDINNRLTVYWDGGSCRVFTNVGGSAAIRITSSQPSSTGVWEHWALVKSGGTSTLYMNGVEVGAAYNMPVPNYQSSTTLALGFQHFNGITNDYFKGYLDDVRIVKSVAVYTAPFTPPNAPLEVVPGATVNTLQAGDYTIGRGSASFNARPIAQRMTVDLRDRAPFGMPVTPSETQGAYSELRPWQFKGRGRIAGTVKEKASPSDKPVRRRVRLYREPDGRLVRTVWSDPVTGAYEFYGIPMDARYTVVSHDYKGVYRAVLADNLAPELIP